MQLYIDDEEDFDESDGFDEENDDEEDGLDDEDAESEEENPSADEPESEEQIEEELEKLRQEEQENEEAMANFKSDDPDKQDAQTDKYLGKKEEIDKKRKDLEAKQAEMQQKKEKKMLAQMKGEARDKLSVQIPSKEKCPICKKNSLFTEPGVPLALKYGLFYGVLPIIGVTINYKCHMACYNPKCKSYYLKTGDLFNVDDIGNVKKLPTKNPFYISRK